MKLARTIIRLDLAGDELPAEFLIWKAGINTTANGYDVLWDEAAAAATMAAYAKHGVDLMIDLNHHSLDDKHPNYDPDARGWCKLELRDGELWAVDVRWTPEGADRLRSKKQRYTSPAFVLDEAFRCVEIVNVALVGMPGTDELPALVAAAREVPARVEADPIEVLVGRAIMKKLGAADVTDALVKVAELQSLASRPAALAEQPTFVPYDHLPTAEEIRANIHGIPTTAKLARDSWTGRPDHSRRLQPAVDDGLTDHEREICAKRKVDPKKYLETKRALEARTTRTGASQ